MFEPRGGVHHRAKIIEHSTNGDSDAGPGVQPNFENDPGVAAAKSWFDTL